MSDDAELGKILGQMTARLGTLLFYHSCLTGDPDIMYKDCVKLRESVRAGLSKHEADDRVLLESWLAAGEGV